MRKFTKKILAGTLALSIIGTSSGVFAATYQVKSGDTFWKIAYNNGISTQKLMTVNNATEKTIIYPGQTLTIPEDGNNTYYTVKYGDTPWLISNKFGVSLNELLSSNNLNKYSYIYPGQKLKIPNNYTSTPQQTKPYVTYITHTVKSGDNFWNLSVKYGISYSEILKVNNANSSTVLSIGDKVKIPVHHVPVMATPGSQYGEYMDWWEGAQYVIPRGAVFKVVDFYTGKSFMAKRTTGSNHADCEPLSYNDTNIMKSIWGGKLNWTRRPIIIEYKGRRIAASAAGMPHAGVDSVQGGAYTGWRSDGYGAGTNYDYVKGNGMDGHFDIHFLNSTRHKDGMIDSTHQKNVKIAAGK